MDLSLNEEFCELANETAKECLSEMQKYWSEISASNALKRREWLEIVDLLKNAPLKFKVNKLRNDITAMWEKCFISQRDRDKFVGFHSTQFSEKLLEEHRGVLEKLNAYYIQHKEIIELISKYEEMWKSVLHIQERSHDPERLFKNRGAALLKEEQDRKLISKIPVMQKTILKALLKKESEGVMFLIRGQRFSDIIRDHVIKKEEKKALKRTPERVGTGGPSSKKCRPDLNGLSNTSHHPGRSRVVKHLQMNS